MYIYIYIYKERERLYTRIVLIIFFLKNIYLVYVFSYIEVLLNVRVHYAVSLFINAIIMNPYGDHISEYADVLSSLKYTRSDRQY